MTMKNNEFFREGGENGKKSWKILTWFKLFTLVTRLSLCCSWLGHVLATYQGSEQAVYHLFPQMPWIMPITVSLGITALVAFGLQPSSILKRIFTLLFYLLFTTFIVLSVYKLWQEYTTVILDFTVISKVPSGMTFFLVPLSIDASGKKTNNNSAQFWFTLLAMGIITILNERVECNSIGNCVSQFYQWYEPFYLALSVSCLGLCLPDFFTVTSDLLKTSPELNEILTAPLSRIHFSPPIILGIICTCLVYFCHTTILVLLSGTSFLLELAIENVYTLNSSFSNRPRQRDASQEHVYLQLENGQNVQSLSDTDSCSDIDTIVEEYLSQVQVVSDLNLAASTYLKSISYIFKMILTTIAVCSLLMSLAIQSKLYVMGLCLLSGTISLIIVLQWASSKQARMLGKPVPSVFSVSVVYSANIFFLGYTPLYIWLYIIAWTVKGGIMNFISVTLEKLGKRANSRQVFSIRESPPTFETSCTNNFVKKPKIIHA